MEASILEKIQKCLELARRGGTEGEAQAAMHRVQALLAKHNLSLAEVEEHEVDPVTVEKRRVRGVEEWHRTVYNAISKLYFCSYFFCSFDTYENTYTKAGKKRHTIHNIIGRRSNIVIVQNVADYIIDLGRKLAEKHSKHDMRQRNNFKKGFASRIYRRVEEQIELAKKGKLMEENTCTALVVHPLYASCEAENQDFIKNSMGVKNLKSRSTSVTDWDSFAAGGKAANGVSLGNDKLGSGNSRRGIS